MSFKWSLSYLEPRYWSDHVSWCVSFVPFLPLWRALLPRSFQGHCWSAGPTPLFLSHWTTGCTGSLLASPQHSQDNGGPHPRARDWTPHRRNPVARAQQASQFLRPTNSASTYLLQFIVLLLYLKLKCSIGTQKYSAGQPFVLSAHHVQEGVVHIVSKAKTEEGHVSPYGRLHIFLDLQYVGLSFTHKHVRS